MPVARRIVRQATETRGAFKNAAALALIAEPGPEGARARRELGEEILRERTQIYISDGLVLGYRYDPSPIVWADGTPAPAESVSEYVPTARPGSRAPHAWFAPGQSTIDLFGNGFVLLALGPAPPETAGFAAAAAKRHLPLRIDELGDPAIAALYESKLALVRPDGHVAWRGDSAPQDPLAVIDLVRGAA